MQHPMAPRTDGGLTLGYPWYEPPADRRRRARLVDCDRNLSKPLEKVTQISPALPPGGERFGRYRLIERVGKGGMAEVFCAVAEGPRELQPVFVIKRIRPDRTDSPKFVQMFCDEARISALLAHPNIVRIYDFGQIDGAYFMAMEYLRGKDLDLVMRTLWAARAAISPSLAALIVSEVARALHHAHTAIIPDGGPGGIVHRDVTPSNIMLLWNGGVKILDFGIAKAASEARARDGKPPKVEGKLAYLSPELVLGGEIDGRSDIFALGVVLWEMLAGCGLFTGPDEYETMRNVLVQPIAAPSQGRPGVPAALDAIVARALERDPARRYQTACDLADDLDRFLAGTPSPGESVSELLRGLFGAEPGADPDAGAGPQSSSARSVSTSRYSERKNVRRSSGSPN
jgi:eukaryotic-like serine/threonine-protein kinase